MIEKDGAKQSKPQVRVEGRTLVKVKWNGPRTADFHYESQMVFSEIKSKQDYLDYINPKLETVKASGTKVWAEMALLTHSFPGPCVVLAQGEKENLVALVLAEVKGDLIKRIDMCIVPNPQAAKRSGEYPS